MRFIHLVLGTLAVLSTTLRSAGSRPRDERGLSQSTENAILLAGAVAVASIVIAVVTAYVRRNLPQ